MTLSLKKSVATPLFAALMVGGSAAAYAQGGGSGYWHTSGARILDANNRQVRIAGISWYGFETANELPGGLATQDYKTILQTVKLQGFNTLRIPISSKMIESPSVPAALMQGNEGSRNNTDLRGFNSMQVLDRIVSYAGTVGLRVILDHHRSEAGNSAQENGLWYTASYPEQNWINDWVTLAQHFSGNPTVVGFDLHNEPHSTKDGNGACWDCGGARDWHLAAERAGGAVLRANPKLIIFVEGTDTYNGDSYWWGGNLAGVASSPVVLPVANHLVYSAHDYGPQEAAQTWFNGATSYESLTSIWNRHWAYISKQGIAPVWLGEFGTTNNATDLQNQAPGSQGQWFQSMIHFLNADPNLSWSYWALNGDDTYGFLDTAHAAAPVNLAKASMLASIRSPLNGTVAATEEKAPSSSGMGLLWTLVGGSGLTFAMFLAPGTSKDKDKDVEPAMIAAGNAPMSAQPLATPLPPRCLGVEQGKAPLTLCLTWKESLTPGATYNVYMHAKHAGGSGTLVSSGVTGNSLLVSFLQPDSPYCFSVRAVTGGLISAASNRAVCMTGAAPEEVAPKMVAASTHHTNSGSILSLISTNKGSFDQDGSYTR